MSPNAIITASPGEFQRVSAKLLLPSRGELSEQRLARQRNLQAADIPRFTPIQVTIAGVIWDGHHAVRAAAEADDTVEVLVVAEKIAPSAPSILDLPVSMR